MVYTRGMSLRKPLSLDWWAVLAALLFAGAIKLRVFGHIPW
jgi:hypothetical protein